MVEVESTHSHVLDVLPLPIGVHGLTTKMPPTFFGTIKVIDHQLLACNLVATLGTSEHLIGVACNSKSTLRAGTTGTHMFSNRKRYLHHNQSSFAFAEQVGF